MVLTVILAETHAEERLLERTPPIQARPVKKGARRINRRSWATRQGGVDDNVLIVRARRRQHRRTPSRCQRSTVAGWISTSASRHLGHSHRKNSQNSRSAARKQAPKDDVLSHLVAARDEAGTGLSDEEITKEMVHIFFAGYGLMSANLGYAMIALGQNESVRERVRAEAQQASDAPTLEDLLGMAYTGQVWKEIMRVYPSAPHTFMAQVIAPVEVGGYQIPAGWRAMGMIYPSLHSEQFFADPERFDPDRFGPERAEDQKAPNSFVAQGGGPPESHRCLGESVSAVVMKLFLSRVVRNHSWELRSTPIIDTQFPVAPKGGVPVRFHRL